MWSDIIYEYDAPSFRQDEIEIINRLSSSLLDKSERENEMASENVDLYSCFHDEWGKDKNVDEYSEELRHDLLSSKEIESW
ncbi:hypothetical protein [uncultured Bacteroides sp.]|uniref:hypothetical protein n=1 Tax=uncultured Bacteroides sp. TaxID=162156 RepID=UPI002583453C|nr:hypothetical protein [uncultured Bacteroides sp.]